MRIGITTDMEGVAGVNTFDAWTMPGGYFYDIGKELLTDEVNAAVRGFLENGFDEAIIFDAHGHGGVDIRKIPLDDYQKLIAYVSQDNYLFDMSVMENIRLGNPKASDEEVMKAAKACGCHEFILGLENGYETICGGSGSHLSGGERQRISIARAMLKNAPIIILDEATAYTDPENEALVQRSVAKLVQGRTLLVIAHRLSTIASADQIILINEGNMEASGTQEELLAESALYRRMWQAHIAAKEGESNV